MTTTETCLLIVALLPFVWTVCAKSKKGYDNRMPRNYLAKLEGWRGRSSAAHQNSWEALALFTAALAVVWHKGVNTPHIDQLAIAFVVIRVLHGLLYLLGWAPLRSLVWFGGMICIVLLFIASA